jgi:hypothetical protein
MVCITNRAREKWMVTSDNSPPRPIAPFAATCSGPLRGTVLLLPVPVPVAVPVTALTVRGQGQGRGLGWMMRGQRAADAAVASTGAGAAAPPEHRSEEALRRDSG